MKIMKKIFNILAVATLALGISACLPVPEDAFPTDPVAPQFYAHNDILMTSNTMDEDVTFSWTPYRFLAEGLSYELSATYGGTTTVLTNTTDKYFTVSKARFREILYQAFPSLPVNATFPMTFRVSVFSGEKLYSSSDLQLNIYAYGDAVAPVVEVAQPSIVLNPEDPQGVVDIAIWEPARLVFGEEIKYNVYVQVVAEDGPGEPYMIAEGLSDTHYSTTVDALNEAIVAAGGPEAADVYVNVIVSAACASIPDGVPSAPASMMVTTYLATFPDELYLPGSYQGWSPATAPTIPQSKTQKGYYEGIVDLRTEDGEDCQFKFSPVPAWEGDFGGVVEVSYIPNGDGYNVAVGTVGVSDNIVVPSGIYDIALNKKLNKITMVEVKAITMIGAACGDFSWGQDVEMDFDLEAKTFTTTTTLKPGEFKFRLNHDWTYTIGDTMGVLNGGNNLTNSNEGDYKVILNTSTCPFSIKYINTSFPDVLYVPGSHNGWSFDHVPLNGDGEGHYEGFMYVGGEWGFKLTPIPDWSKGEWGLDSSVEPYIDDKGGVVFTLTSSGAGNIMEGSNINYCRVHVDLSELTIQVIPINTVEVVGGFTSWGTDPDFMLAYGEDTDSWKIEGVEIPAKAEWKFRMNSDWAVNLGYGDDRSLENLVQDGSNFNDIEAGIYTIELFIHTWPYKAVLTKTGEGDEPTLPETMYLIGEGIEGWSLPGDEVAMIPVHSHPGCFWAIRYIEADKGFKFTPVATGWGQDFYSLGDYESGFYVENGNCYVPESGIYMIGVDYGGEHIVVEPAKVFGIGDCFNGWAESVPFDFSDGYFVSPKLNAGEIRMYATCSAFNADWWQMEFVFYNGLIAYRGDGGDQERVAMNGGETVFLDFNAGTATVYQPQ